MPRRERAGSLPVAPRDASRALPHFRDRGVPVVLLTPGPGEGTLDLVTVDGAGGTFLTTEHLRDRNRRGIARFTVDLPGRADEGVRTGTAVMRRDSSVARAEG